MDATCFAFYFFFPCIVTFFCPRAAACCRTPPQTLLARLACVAVTLAAGVLFAAASKVPLVIHDEHGHEEVIDYYVSRGFDYDSRFV